LLICHYCPLHRPRPEGDLAEAFDAISPTVALALLGLLDACFRFTCDEINRAIEHFGASHQSEMDKMPFTLKELVERASDLHAKKDADGQTEWNKLHRSTWLSLDQKEKEKRDLRASGSLVQNSSAESSASHVSQSTATQVKRGMAVTAVSNIFKRFQKFKVDDVEASCTGFVPGMAVRKSLTGGGPKVVFEKGAIVVQKGASGIVFQSGCKFYLGAEKDGEQEGRGEEA
jgi:hypothetical protein